MLNPNMISRFTIASLLMTTVLGCASTNNAPSSPTVSDSHEHLDYDHDMDHSDLPEFQPAADTRVMTVYGMSCPLCATNVDKQLLRVPGVEKVDVNLADGKIQVKIDEQNAPTDERLKDAVVESGFTFKSIE